VLAWRSFGPSRPWCRPSAGWKGVGMTAMEARITSLTADGGTDIYRSLEAGAEAAKRADAQYRHVILMTDGMSCCNGNYAALIDGMHSANVTLSTIAVGGEADTQLLSHLHPQRHAPYYFPHHPPDI